MKFRPAVDEFITDMRSHGRIGSQGSEKAYRDVLYLLGGDADWRDPRQITRDDVKRTLRRWENPNTARTRRSIMVSFFDWMAEEGMRRDNPARATRRPKSRPVSVRRLTEADTVALLKAASTPRERRAIFLGVCAGLRNQELRGLQGRHFRRDGFVWVSSDIAKGQRERWVPVPLELVPVIEEIRANVAVDHFVLPRVKQTDPGINVTWLERPTQPCSHQSLYRLVGRVGEKAGVAVAVHPHMLRRAYADYVGRHAGVMWTRALLGHADISTTQDYLSAPSPDELARAIEGLTFTPVGGQGENDPVSPAIARRGFEPLNPTLRGLEPYPAFRTSLSGSLAIGRPS